MKRKHLSFFIVYAVLGLIGLLIYANGLKDNLIFLGSLFLIMAAAVHFKNWKTQRIEEIKKGV